MTIVCQFAVNTSVDDIGYRCSIGGLGVMTSLMAKAMHDVDLIWVVPKVQGVEYREAESQDCIKVNSFGQSFDIGVSEYTFSNVTYVMLDHPVFQAQSPSIPYPERMNDLNSAVYCEYVAECQDGFVPKSKLSPLLV